MSFAFTYTGDPSSADVDAVRFEISDTDPSAPLLQDGEIEWAILQEAGQPAGSPTVLSDQQVYRSAARCMETISRRLAAQASSTIGQLKLNYDNQSKTYALRAKELRDRAAGMSVPFAGGQSDAEKTAMEQQQDLPQPMFRRREYDNPFATGGTLPGLPPLPGQ